MCHTYTSYRAEFNNGVHNIKLQDMLKIFKNLEDNESHDFPLLSAIFRAYIPTSLSHLKQSNTTSISHTETLVNP